MDGSEHIAAGRVLGAHGVAGAIKVAISSDVPDRFDAGQVVYIQGSPYRIASSARTRSDQIILTFHGLNNLAKVRRLAGSSVTVPVAAAPELPPGEYFHFQLLGLRVFTEDGEGLGRVTEVVETGSNDVYVVTGEGGDILLPALAEIIREIDLGQGLMEVHLLEGLR